MTQRYTTLAYMLEKLKARALPNLDDTEAKRINADCQTIQSDINRLSFIVGKLIIQHCAADQEDRVTSDGELLCFAGDWITTAAELIAFCEDVRIDTQ